MKKTVLFLGILTLFLASCAGTIPFAFPPFQLPPIDFPTWITSQRGVSEGWVEISYPLSVNTQGYRIGSLKIEANVDLSERDFQSFDFEIYLSRFDYSTEQEDLLVAGNLKPALNSFSAQDRTHGGVENLIDFINNGTAGEEIFLSIWSNYQGNSDLLGVIFTILGTAGVIVIS